MIVSMTGFGRSERNIFGKNISVELRSLNNRGLEITAKLPFLYRDLELPIRKIIGAELQRGKIALQVFIEEEESTSASLIDKAVLKSYINQLSGIEKNIDKSALMKMAISLPDVVKKNAKVVSKEEQDVFLDLIYSALSALKLYREEEGKPLEKEFNKYLKNILHLLGIIEKKDGERKENITRQLKTALSNLDVSVDASRFEQELIYYLEKYDITEEKVRLQKHLSYFSEIIKEKPPLGKKLGFLTQEILREINTIGSKANHAEIQKIIVQIKEEIEKIREQLFNVL